jgi:uncharacterized membrane protein
MSLQSLLSASLEIRVHAIVAVSAFFLGAWQLLRPKGTKGHRVVGWLWVLLMAIIAVSSLFINTICTFGPFSWIHLLTLLTIFTLPMGVLAARRHDINAHKRIMLMLFAGALVVAGAFTFMPGRIMHDVAFGTSSSHGRCWPISS